MNMYFASAYWLIEKLILINRFSVWKLNYCSSSNNIPPITQSLWGISFYYPCPVIIGHFAKRSPEFSVKPPHVRISPTCLTAPASRRAPCCSRDEHRRKHEHDAVPTRTAHKTVMALNTHSFGMLEVEAVLTMVLGRRIRLWSAHVLLNITASCIDGRTRGPWLACFWY